MSESCNHLIEKQKRYFSCKFNFAAPSLLVNDAGIHNDCVVGPEVISSATSNQQCITAWSVVTLSARPSAEVMLNR